MFRMNGIYVWLAAMGIEELEDIAGQLQHHPDPWAVGARKLIDFEIWHERKTNRARKRNKIISF